VRTRLSPTLGYLREGDEGSPPAEATG